jgi:hypothetical protein
MSSYSDYDLERDLRDARRARARAAGRTHGAAFSQGGIGNWLRSRTTEHWIMFAIGLAVGGVLF